VSGEALFAKRASPQPSPKTSMRRWHFGCLNQEAKAPAEHRVSVKWSRTEASFNNGLSSWLRHEKKVPQWIYFTGGSLAMLDRHYACPARPHRVHSCAAIDDREGFPLVEQIH